MTQLQTINTFSSLDAVFGTSPSQPVVLQPAKEETLPVVYEESDQSFPPESDLMSDYQKARESMRALLDKGELVVDNMLQIATQTESARSFEVAGNLIKTMSDVAKDLVALHKATNDARKKNAKEESGPRIIKNTQNNVVFKGTTTELFDMMENEQ